MPLFRRRHESRSDGARLFFATDIHGSDVCFRKFVNAAAFYGARYLVLGGDITGKAIVPIERTARGFTAAYLDDTYVDMSEDECASLEKRVRDAGLYPLRGERDELLALEDEEHRERVFTGLVVARIEQWVALAEDRLAGTKVRCFITPGNDDFWEIDVPLAGSNVVEFVEGRCVELDESHEMITTGYSNITPWRSPRELDEDALRARIDAMFADVREPESLVAVLHPPPLGSGLDDAPAIDEEFRVRFEAGGVVLTGVGSTAVRAFIEERQPLLGLHGHVHESKAITTLGRTVCINPGSEYNDGTLCGALVTLSGGGIEAHQLVVG